jgi:hypothetical protein
MRLLLVLLLSVMPGSVLAAESKAENAQTPRAAVQQLFADHFMHDMGFTQALVARKRAWMTPGRAGP